jgi:hypothetical protein
LKTFPNVLVDSQRSKKKSAEYVFEPSVSAFGQNTELRELSKVSRLPDASARRAARISIKPKNSSPIVSVKKDDSLQQESVIAIDSSVVQLEGPSSPFQIEAQRAPLFESFVLVIVVGGIISFAVFQIIQCVAAYNRPITTTDLETRTRVLPGLMICPYSSPVSSIGYEIFRCERLFQGRGKNTPLWAPDATLSFDYLSGMNPPCSIHSKSYDVTGAVSFLSVVDPVSLAKRSSCPNAIDPAVVTGGSSGGTPPVVFGVIDQQQFQRFQRNPEQYPGDPCVFGNSARKITVKNSAKSLNCTSAGCRSSETFTPPNVQCLVYDPSFFDADSKPIPGKHSDCNPMREVNANTLDTFQVAFPHLGIGGYGTYEYSGLRCSETSPSRLKLSVQDFNNQLNSWSMISENHLRFGNNVTLFGNFLALAYDSQKGIPKDIDFDDVTSIFSNGAISSSQEDHILASSVLSLVEYERTPFGPPTPPFLRHRVNPVSLQASLAVKTRYTNVALDQSITTETPSAVFAPLTNHPYRIPSNIILMSFSTVVTAVSKEVVTLSILTTISIIVSTAGTLWNAQEKIKNGVLMVAARCGIQKHTKLTQNIRN